MQITYNTYGNIPVVAGIGDDGRPFVRRLERRMLTLVFLDDCVLDIINTVCTTFHYIPN